MGMENQMKYSLFPSRENPTIILTDSVLPKSSPKLLKLLPCFTEDPLPSRIDKETFGIWCLSITTSFIECDLTGGWYCIQGTESSTVICMSQSISHLLFWLWVVTADIALLLLYLHESYDGISSLSNPAWLFTTNLLYELLKSILVRKKLRPNRPISIIRKGVVQFQAVHLLSKKCGSEGLVEIAAGRCPRVSTSDWVTHASW